MPARGSLTEIRARVTPTGEGTRPGQGTITTRFASFDESSPVPSAYRAVAALLVSVFLLLTGNGLLITVIPLAAKAHGHSEVEIGFLGSAYFAGMLVGALVNPRLVGHSGHARAYTASVALAVIATLGFAVFEQAYAWILFRGVLGFCFAGLYATVESWLQGKSDNTMRGRVLGLYSVVQYGGWAAGNQLLHLAEPTSFTLFSAAAALLAAAIVPLTVTTQDPPERPGSPELPVLWLIRTSPIGVVGVTLIGWSNGAFWSLSPVFAAEAGLDPGEVGLFMTLLTVGSAALQMPIGRLSDRLDRRLVLLGLLVATAAIEVPLGLFGPRAGLVTLLVVGFALGSVTSTQYYVLTAHVNDRIGQDRVVGVAAVLLLLYCIGAIVGPVTAAAAMARFGAGALYLHGAVVHVVFALYLVARMVRAAAPEARRDDTAPVRPPG